MRSQWQRSNTSPLRPQSSLHPTIYVKGHRNDLTLINKSFFKVLDELWTQHVWHAERVPQHLWHTSAHPCHASTMQTRHTSQLEKRVANPHVPKIREQKEILQPLTLLFSLSVGFMDYQLEILHFVLLSDAENHRFSFSYFLIAGRSTLWSASLVLIHLNLRTHPSQPVSRMSTHQCELPPNLNPSEHHFLSRHLWPSKCLHHHVRHPDIEMEWTIKTGESSSHILFRVK